MADPIQFATPANIRVQPVLNVMGIPAPEGARAISMTFDFSPNVAGALTTYAVDLENYISRKEFSNLSTVYIHNHSGAFVNLRPDGILNFTRCPAFSQGYFPVTFLTPPRFTIQGGPAGQNPTTVVFYNFPIPPIVWPSGFINAKIGSNVSSTGVQMIDVPDFSATKTAFIGGGAAALDNLLFAPGANAAFFLNWLKVDLTGDATFVGAPAELLISISDGTSGIRTFMQTAVWLAAATPVTGNIRVFDLQNLNYISQAFGNNLHIELSNALTAGKLYASAGVGRCNIVSPV